MTDMEFVQFHPTTLCLDGAPSFLISESVRGEGAILLNIRGERFMNAYHEMEELAPRDVVSRAIVAEVERTNSSCVFLDLTHLRSEFIKGRFPTIYERCSSYGLDIARDLIPVNVSVHFMMGGIKTNLQAETNIRGLYACGEAACTSVHGANRLASNSLLEGLVFGVRAAFAAVSDIETKIPAAVFKMKHRMRPMKSEQIDADIVRELIQDLMWEEVGIIRDGEMLQHALDSLTEYTNLPDPQPATRNDFELQNMLDLAGLIAKGALIRQESRGAHYRSDYPYRDDSKWHRHITFKSTVN
jgi:L-aspartate oxidase